MVGSTEHEDIVGGAAPIEIELDAYVLPDGHSVFKLFPGQTYRLNKEIVAANAAFLDIRGLDGLVGNPHEWTDEQLRKIIADDRVRRELISGKPSKKPGAQDTKRLRFLRNLLFKAKKGDLIVVPLGKGLDGEVAIGEFEDGPGVLRAIVVKDGDAEFSTFGRPIRWRTQIEKRRRFSHDLNQRLHAPTAFHVLESSYIEEIYLAAYGSFTYGDVYVASFPSEKEHFTTADQANIGIWFNAISVIHQRELGGEDTADSESFVDLGLEESGVELELVRNSPISVVMRTVGPLAFSMLALYPIAVEAKPLDNVQHATVKAKTVAGAVDKCKVVIPPDLAQVAKGLGYERFAQFCKMGQRIESGATVKPTARLYPSSEEHK